MVDTHTHLYDAAFSADGDTPADAVRRAIAAGVERMVLPGCTPADLSAMNELRSLFPTNVFLAAGLHPTELPEPELVDAQLAEIEAELRAGAGSMSLLAKSVWTFIGISRAWRSSAVCLPHNAAWPQSSASR